MRQKYTGKRFTKRAWPTRLKAGRVPPSFQELQLQVAGLERRAQAQERAMDALRRIAEVLDEERVGTQALHRIAEIAREVTNTDAVQIFLLEGDRETLCLRADTNEPEKVGRVRIRVGEGLTGWTAEHKRPVVIKREPWNDPRFLDYPGLDERSFQSLLCVPLISKNQLLGVVNARTRRAYGYTQSEAAILSQIADQVARAIRYQTEMRSLERQAARYEAISEVGAQIVSSPYMEEILQLLVTFTAERLNYKVVTVRLLDEERQELVIRATQSTNRAYRRKPSIKVGESFAGRAVLERRTITVPDVMKAEEYVGPELAAEQSLRSMACVPLILGERVLGVMTCYREKVGEFNRVEIKALEALARQAAIAIAHAKLQVRSTLMQEMHHRVKNDLQHIASLLRLQIAEGRPESLDRVLSDLENRIQAIAAVHDLLSREDLDRVGIKSVAETLAQHHKALCPPEKRITVSVYGDDLPLEIGQATQVALILNELLQNAMEHGFENQTEGECSVVIKITEKDVRLWVSNSGRVLPEDFDTRLDAHLGLKIVHKLAQAVGGSFHLRSAYNWVVAEVGFPRDLGGR